MSSWQDRIPLVLLGCQFVGTKFSHVIASTCLSRMKKLMNISVWKYPQKYISIEQHIWHKSVRNKVNKCLCRISSFYRNSHGRCSAKMLFLNILHDSWETPVLDSLQASRSAVLLKRVSSSSNLIFNTFHCEI